MKRDSKRKIKDYSNYDCDNGTYYGLLHIENKVCIDVKRYLKTMYVTEKVKKGLNKPRNTAYFRPAKYDYKDYNINYFLSVIEAIKKEWVQEIKPAIDSIPTPKEVGDREYGGYWMQTGIMDSDEVSIHANMQTIKRARVYANVVESFYAQFIHQFASRIEAIMVKVLKNNSHEVDHFSRGRLKDIFNGATKMQIEDLETYKYYDKFYKVWNFLKHNSISTYKKIKDNYPEVLYKPDLNEYENGNLAVSYLNLNEDMIFEFANKLTLFFKEFCSVFFHENVDEADWNYELYFVREVESKIDEIVNPLGLPSYL